VKQLTLTRWLTLATGMAMIVTVAGCGVPNQASNNTTGSTTGTTGTNTASTGSTSNQSAASNTSGTQSPQLQWSSPPAMQIDVNKQYDAVVHTNYGNFTIQLFAKSAPHTVNNFVFLAKHNYYDNNQFFRIIQSFMIQTGDPTNTGTGTPGYSFNDELPPKDPYGPGIVAMANAGPNTNGSQFFICTGAESQSLPPQYTEFGKVVSGMSTVQKIAAIPVVANPNMGGEMSKPTKKAYIESVAIEVK
jgi:cyclophilin family peptidyl-prolyl cis-trans isomerase